jgi:alkylated DNA repair dioxygenase AlkB
MQGAVPHLAIEQSLFAARAPLAVDPALTGGLAVAADASFGTRERFDLDEHSWIDHVHGWLDGDIELMESLLTAATWEHRRRWMYTRMVDEPRLTAEYPTVDDVPVPAVRYVAAILGRRYGVAYRRVWMNWYRSEGDGTGWHADKPAADLAEAVIPVLSLGATRRFLIRPKNGGRSTAFVAHGGDLVVMGGRCQRDWVHMVPKQPQPAGPRVSLNFSVGVS